MDELNRVLNLEPYEQFLEMKRLYCSGKLGLVIDVSKVLKERNTPVKGTWERAKAILNSMDEPDVRIDISGKNELQIYQPPVLGYPCQYVWHRTKSGYKSWLVIFNGETNSCHTHDFHNLTDKEVDNIFNG